MLIERNGQSVPRGHRCRGVGRGGARVGAGRKRGESQPERQRLGEALVKVARVPAGFDVAAVVTCLGDLRDVVAGWEDLLAESAGRCGGVLTSPRLLMVRELLNEVRGAMRGV